MNTKLRNPSHVQLPLAARGELVQGLNKALGTTLDLAFQVKQAHWNIRGPQFFARHELFDRLAKSLYEMADTIAERAATLGGYAEGTLRLSAKNSDLPEYDLKAADGAQHILVLTERYGAYTGMLREALAKADESEDPVTEDLYTECLRAAELDLWFLESHISKP
jgi:starvation-inducible DNA-binding protein